MKSVKEITAIISKLRNQVKELESKSDALWRTSHDEATAAYQAAADLKKVIAVWCFNLLHAKKAELLPIWVKVMNEYQGKKIGEVKKKEIREKLKAFGVSGYFTKYEYSSPKIHLVFLDENGYTHGTSDYIELTGDYNISWFDENNKFIMPDLTSFKFYGESTPYIENPKQYIKNLEKLAAKAKKAAAEYNKVLHDYNAAAVPGFNQIKTYNEEPRSIAEYFRIL